MVGPDHPTPPPGTPGWLEDELIGLDRDDPETRAFAAHLTRMHSTHPGFTVEGYLTGVREFADSAIRAQGHRWLVAVTVVSLVLLGAALVLWDAFIVFMRTLFG